MSSLVVVGTVAAALAAVSGWLAARLARQRGQVREAAALRAEICATRAALSSSKEREESLARRVTALEGDLAVKDGCIEDYDRQMEWQKAELLRRPRVIRKTYKILTVGVSGTGKTSLTLKWANPLVDLGTLEGTKIERYERTVSQARGHDVTTEHVFEIGDWGGEHIVDAQHELVVEEVHGLLMVVDLASRDGKTLDPERVQEQLAEFQPQALRFFFGPRMLASCKTVVLFINKSDVLSGTPAEVEREARGYYKRLIDDLGGFESQLDVRVLVGSAQYGQSTHHLFAHFVERILPKSAYDNQLMQRMKGDTERLGGGASAGVQPPPLVVDMEATLTLPTQALVGAPGLAPMRVAPRPGRPSHVAEK